ncbi:MAG: CDP-alcohol phosphatidyltransferase family protein [Deltaproteobacteria bacterium]|nr:CDP-alcohol phosphatidyltransferase family protein [Deltaproteobacteria bacterium]
MALDAIVLADADVARVKIAGLSARDRAARIAQRLGARTLVITDAADRAQLTAWRGGRDVPVLVIRADQLVHTPLVAPLIAAPEAPLAIAVGPDNDYGGAFLARGEAATRAVEALARGESDVAIAATADVRVPHGEIARHPIATAEDQRGAQALLFRLLIKPQDNVITRYLFRPISSRISRLLVHLPITATQVSIVVAILVALGCWMTLSPRTEMMIGGALVILFATYLDCCDGEIARIKLQASTFGAWLDTIVDELSSIGYMLAIGWHCHLVYGPNYFGDLGFDPWIASIWIGLAIYLWCLFGIYYNIIVGVGSANSQDYVQHFIIVPGSRPGSVRLAPKPPKERNWPRWAKPIIDFLPNIVRRDFIVWLAASYAVFNVPHLSFATHVLGGVVSGAMIMISFFHLRAVRRAARKQGVLEPPKR